MNEADYEWNESDVVGSAQDIKNTLPICKAARKCREKVDQINKTLSPLHSSVGLFHQFKVLLYFDNRNTGQSWKSIIEAGGGIEMQFDPEKPETLKVCLLVCWLVTFKIAFSHLSLCNIPLK